MSGNREQCLTTELEDYESNVIAQKPLLDAIKQCLAIAIPDLMQEAFPGVGWPGERDGGA